MQDHILLPWNSGFMVIFGLKTIIKFQLHFKVVHQHSLKIPTTLPALTYYIGNQTNYDLYSSLKNGDC